MSAKKRILFIANEMSPYLELTEFSEIVNKLAIKANDNNFEVRCIMPRFGTINERRHRLHEVVRLSGINVSIDNEDLFKRKYVFQDEKEKWYDDNALRTVFFCKGALETVKKFGWPPDLIHCSGWMAGLIPFYLKTVYKKEPVFSHSKIIYTIGQNTFSNKLGSDFVEKAMIHASLKEKDLEIFKDANNASLFRAGATYADAITFGSPDVDKKLVEEFTKVRGKKTLPYNQESDLTDYLQLYVDLATK